MIVVSPTALSGQELIEIVDEHNNVLAPKYRYEMRRDKLIHRATYALVHTKSNYYFVQKRSTLKDYCPGHFDPTPGGVVAAGESYETTNAREIEEEMGITGVTPTHLFTFYYEDERIRCFGDVWDVLYEGALVLQAEEVESVHMMTMSEILQSAEAGELFTPDSVFACKEFIRRFGCPEAHGERPAVSVN